MRHDAIMCLVIMGVLCAACAPKEHTSHNDWTVVKTEGGMISGTLTDSVHIFKGIPFAEPPVNELRWREPQPVKPWADTLACMAFGASAMQNDPKPFMMWSQEFITPAKPMSEDCLFLNVWTAARSQEEKRPVLVWIHGGAFLSGSGACPVYDGEALAKAGMVYVTINYRLGVFGFMAHPELTAESQHESSGNYGLLDQVAALQWIKNNIAAFGGDPSRVTIAGQSAGSMAVQALVASPLTKGLFHGAIAESGAMTGRPSMPLSEAEKTGTTLSKKINSGSIEDLRKLSADSLLSLANTLPFGSFFPIVDGHVLPADVKSIFQNKQHNDVPVVAGWVTGDADLVLRDLESPSQFKASAQTRYGNRSTEFLKLFSSEDEAGAHASQRKLALLQFAGYPDREWALSNRQNTYVYEFTYVPTDKPGFPNYGAFHTSEVPYALHTLKHWDRPWVEADRQVEAYMSSYWINFVKTGDPNGKGLPEWKKYEAATGNIQELGAVSEARPGKYVAEFEFLKSVKP